MGMIGCMRKHLLSIIAAGVLFAAPSSAMAQDEEKTYDARLAGHADNVVLDTGGTALTYLLLAGLGVLCVGVMFKNSKRTHLD